MAPPRSAAASSKRGARPRAPLNPSPAPPNPSPAPPNPSPAPPPAAPDPPRKLQRQFLHEMRYGSLRALNRLVEEAKKGGVGALHYAAFCGYLPVCGYLVENLGVDVNAFDDKARTPLSCATTGGSVDTVSYLFDHGADPGKANDQGFTALHHAATTGDCKMVEFLLAKGVSVDPVSVIGTPLHVAASGGHDEAMKILLENKADAGADVNEGLVTPLASAADKGLTACLNILLEAGADPNVTDSIGRMPMEIAALNCTREGVEILFPATSCIPSVHDWSIDGIIRHAKSVFMDQGSNVIKIAELRSRAANSIKRNDYITAANLYSMAIKTDPHDATLLSKRSLCWCSMGDADKALVDALACREMRPTWPEACYRQAAAFMLLKDYRSACDAFLDAAKLDLLSPKIMAGLREALDSLKLSHGVGRRLSLLGSFC